MKRITILLLVLSVTFVLSSCWSTQFVSLAEEYTQIWKNSSKNEIIRNLGAPNRIIEIDEGESVLVYESYQYYTNSSSKGSSSVVNYIPNTVFHNNNSSSSTSEKRYYTEFYLDKENKCYAVRTTDTKPIRVSEPKQTTALVLGITGGLTAYILLFYSLFGK